jgi:YD repeat-containing protein
MQEIYKGSKKKDIKILKDFLENNEAPPWRKSSDDNGKNYDPSEEEKAIVNVALHLRRPILLGGSPGIGKSSLAKSVAFELTEGKLLHWQITTHSVLKDGLYEYDAVGRLQDVKDDDSSEEIGTFVTLGALGSAFASDSMRVVLIDELDKSDIDFPNNLLHVLEEQEFPIPELARTGKNTHTVYDADGKKVEITLEDGKLKCKVFPLIIFTSNKEREFPAAFMRRVLSHDITLPDDEIELENKLFKILENHLKTYKTKDNVKVFQEIEDKVRKIIQHFIKETKHEDKQLSTDQLMHAVFLQLQGIDIEKEKILKKIWHKLAD